MLKRALRAPVFLYAIGADRLLGHRFLLLTHRGRCSGRAYRTVLEVVDWDADQREAIVVSGFGRRSDWLLNAFDGGAVEVRIGGSAFRPQVRELSADEAVRALAAYERRNRLGAPIVRAVLSRLAGFRYDSSDGARRALVERLPIVGLRDVGKAQRVSHA